MVWVAACCLTIYFAIRLTHRRGGVPAAVGFGASPDQCAAAYGWAKVVTNNKVLVSPQTRGYVIAGWNIMIGFDEKGRAEQFVYSVASLDSLVSKPPDLSEAEKKSLLDKFQGGSRWTVEANTSNGPIWQRDDD